MPKRSTRVITVQLGEREQKAAVTALLDAARAAPKGSRFRDWAASIAEKIRAAPGRDYHPLPRPSKEAK